MLVLTRRTSHTSASVRRLIIVRIMSDIDHDSQSRALNRPLPAPARPASPSVHPLSAITAPTPPTPSPSPFTAAVIFLHGVGSTGEELRSQLSMLVQPSLEQRFPHVRFLFPTAPLRSFTAFKGRVLPAWFDRAGYGLQWQEDVDGLHESCAQLKALTEQCNEAGISNQRIMIGGFSMGGAQAIHAAYSKYGATSPFPIHSTAAPVPLAGCFCIASYLPRACSIPSSLSSDTLSLATPLLFLHGSSDIIVRPSWAEDTCRRLKQAGVVCLFNMYDGQIHAVSPHQLDDLSTFIAQFLPRDIKSLPALPSVLSQQASEQQPQQQQQQQQQQHGVDEEKGKLAQQIAPLSVDSSSSDSSSSVDTAGVSAYLETLKPLNTDLR